MKTLMILALTLLSTSAFAQTIDGQATEIAQVRKLADARIHGSDVKKTIEVYNNVEGNPCAEQGINYIVKVSVRKAHMVNPENPNEPNRSWEEFNQYYITQADLLKGGDLSDTLCQE